MRLSSCSARRASSNAAGSLRRNVIDWNTSPRKTGMNCSFSPQISDSNAEPAALKWHVAVQSRFGQRRAKAVRQGEHADEHRDHEADAEGGERRRDGTLHDAADVVDDGNHSTCRSAWTIGSRAARSAGTRPLASIKPTATSTPRIIVLVVTTNPGRKPAPLKLIAG